MKFLHTIADVFLYLMHKKWNTYVYLESDTTVENFEARIMKFIVTRHPLQFTHCTEIRFLGPCLLKSFVTFTPNNSFLCDTLQNTALCKVLHRIYGSTLLCTSSQFSLSDTCFSLHSLNMNNEIFPQT